MTVAEENTSLFQAGIAPRMVQPLARSVLVVQNDRLCESLCSLHKWRRLMFITVLVKAPVWNYTEPFHSVPQLGIHFCTNVLNFIPRLYVGILRLYFPLWFLTKILCSFRVRLMQYTCYFVLLVLNFITVITVCGKHKLSRHPGSLRTTQRLSGSEVPMLFLSETDARPNPHQAFREQHKAWRHLVSVVSTLYSIKGLLSVTD
jgi:hypothetical protein